MAMNKLVKLFVLLTILSVSIASCSNNGRKDREKKHAITINKETEYLYLDDTDCIHASKSCLNFMLDDGHPNYAIRFVRKSDLHASPDQRFCSECVSVEEYESIMRYSEYGETVEDNYMDTIGEGDPVED